MGLYCAGYPGCGSRPGKEEAGGREEHGAGEDDDTNDSDDDDDDDDDSDDQVTLHLSHLPPDTTPPSLYSALLGHAEGYRHVYTSPKDR